MLNNSPPGDSIPPRLTSRRLRFALLASAFPLPLSNTSRPTCSTRLPHGFAHSILFLRPTHSRFCPPPSAPGRSKKLRDSSARLVSCSSSPAAANPATPKARCPGPSPAPSSPPSPPQAWKNFLSRIFSISKIPQNPPSAAFLSSIGLQHEYIYFSYMTHISFDGIPH